MMQINRDQLIALYKKAIFEDGYSKGHIEVDSPDTAQILQLAFDHEEDSGFQSTQQGLIQVGETRRFFRRDPLSSKFGDFFSDINQLCKHKYFKAKNKRKYYLMDLAWDSSSSEPKPDIINQYEKLLLLIAVLSKSSAFTDSATSRMVFIEPEKLEIDVQYSAQDLDSVDPDMIEKISIFMTDDIHHSQKLAILAKSIVELCKNTPANERFAFILQNLDKIYENLDHDYALFASNFSFEKLKNEIENTKLEEQVKIHKVISDIQNQLLGIPIATVIVATQFKAVTQINKDYNYQFIVNTGVLMGVVIFTLIMFFLVRNQSDSLYAIKVELQRKDGHLQKSNNIIYQKILADNPKGPFSDLFKRLDFQELILISVKWITSIGLVVTIMCYLILTTTPAWLD
ncbi:hypothetical protein GIX10_13065 [Acinetobacter sp. YIM 103518]|uniref:Uncharacterized protein n=2 Tax=Acinetobacter TaxID=469 RepID=A0A6L6GIR3_9GAMM|nr:hypothetical protein [Acinetobacter faecalis]MTD12306.1 hypothetical protein [Acinetobacter faecalis]TCH62499.1 hypothetical protein E0409_13090 [Acinetobacter sp. ANC 4862]